MARGRMLNQSIAKDKKLNDLSIEAEYIYLKSIPHLDRDGLINGDPALLWSDVCPRRPELMQKMQAIIDEIVASGLVIAYQCANDGDTVLFFPGFTKNQQGMRYDREAPSRFGPPPHYTRTHSGLIPTDSTPIAQQENEKESKPRTSAKPNPSELRTNSGLTPDEVPPKVSISISLKEVEGDGGVTPAENEKPTAAAAFISEYERIWSLPIESPYRQEQIEGWIGRVTVDGWQYALKECADHRKVGQWRYLETILKRVEVEGVPLPKPEVIPKQTVTGNLGISMASI